MSQCRTIPEKHWNRSKDVHYIPNLPTRFSGACQQGEGKEPKSEGEFRNRYETGFVNVKSKIQGELFGKVS